METDHYERNEINGNGGWFLKWLVPTLFVALASLSVIGFNWLKSDIEIHENQLGHPGLAQRITTVEAVIPYINTKLTEMLASDSKGRTELREWIREMLAAQAKLSESKIENLQVKIDNLIKEVERIRKGEESAKPTLKRPVN